MTSCWSWVSLPSIKSTITHHSSTFPKPEAFHDHCIKGWIAQGGCCPLCREELTVFCFFPSLDVIAVTLAFETLGHFFDRCWHSLGTFRMFLRCGFNHPFMDLKHAEWGFISSDGLNGSYLLHGCTLRTQICLGGIPDCKSSPGGAFELRWCLDAWDEQCIDDDGTLFQWVTILGSLVLFSSLRQQTPADSRLHPNWSCNASPWRFLSINHSYFLHEGYLKIYDIYIWYTYTIWIFSVSLKAQHPGKTCRMLEVLDCTICRNTSELISTVRGGFLLVRDMLLFLLFLGSCRKKIAKSVIPPNLGRVFLVEQMFWTPRHRWPRDFFILFLWNAVPICSPAAISFPSPKKNIGKWSRRRRVVSACEAKNSSGLVSKYIYYLYLLTVMKNPTNRFISIHFGARK